VNESQESKGCLAIRTGLQTLLSLYRFSQRLQNYTELFMKFRHYARRTSSPTARRPVTSFPSYPQKLAAVAHLREVEAEKQVAPQCSVTETKLARLAGNPIAKTLSGAD
jgi:hypothetical protein